MTINILNMYKVIILIFLPVLVFSQTRDYKRKSKSESFKFLTETNQSLPQYAKDIVLNASKWGYNLDMYDENAIWPTKPFRSLLLTKSISDDAFFPPYSVGEIQKRVFISSHDDFEKAVAICVITEISLWEYSNVSKSQIDNFYKSTTDFILEHIRLNNKIYSSKTNFDKPLFYLYYKNMYPYTNTINYSKIINEHEFKSSLSYSNRSETTQVGDGSYRNVHNLGFQYNMDMWDTMINTFEKLSQTSDKKKETLNKLRNNIGDKNIENINTYDLQEMVQFFLDDCKRSNIIVPSIETLSATFEPLEDGVIALAFGMNNDDQIIIRVDPTNWQKSDLIKKWYVIYHELGHDVLNLEHGEGGKMMFNFADREYTWDEFYNDKDYMFNYVLKRQ